MASDFIEQEVRANNGPPNTPVISTGSSAKTATLSRGILLMLWRSLEVRLSKVSGTIPG